MKIQLLELNARTTMSHYGVATKRRLPKAELFEVIQVGELPARLEMAERNGKLLVRLTDAATAENWWCALPHIAIAIYIAISAIDLTTLQRRG
eukprot:SAG31_NODE_60_length_29419_cov_39.876398_6_plen_93_part_00